MGKFLIINSSYKKHGTTAKVIQQKAQWWESQGNKVETIFLRNNIYDCCGCNKCNGEYNKCIFQDQVVDIINKLKHGKYTDVVFATPVYTDSCTSKLYSLIHRMSMHNDCNGKNVFSNLNAWGIISGGSSGTRAVGHQMLGMFEMLSFNMRGKCITYHVEEWHDKKIRGGYETEQVLYLSKKEEVRDETV